MIETREIFSVWSDYCLSIYFRSSSLSQLSYVICLAFFANIMTRIFLHIIKSFGVSVSILSSDIGTFYELKETLKNLFLSIVSPRDKAVGKGQIILTETCTLSAIVLGLKFLKGKANQMRETRL